MQNLFFETIKCIDQVACNLSFHEKRIAKTIGRNFDLNGYIYPPDDRLYRVKVIYNCDEIVDITYFLYEKKDIYSFKLICDDTIDYSKKLLDRSRINTLYNKRSSCDEIIIIKNNLITDTSIANIAIFLDNQWITPRNPLLEGTTLQRYLQNNQLIQKDITVDMLYNAKKIGLLNAMIDFDILDNFTLKQ